MGPEAKIEKAVCDYAKSKGCLVYKFSSPNHRGVPDRLFITPKGLTVFMEFKAPGKTPTKLQLREIDRIRENKGFAVWTDDVEEGKVFIDIAINHNRAP